VMGLIQAGPSPDSEVVSSRVKPWTPVFARSWPAPVVACAQTGKCHKLSTGKIRNETVSFSLCRLSCQNLGHGKIHAPLAQASSSARAIPPRRLRCDASGVCRNQATLVPFERRLSRSKPRFIDDSTAGSATRRCDRERSASHRRYIRHGNRTCRRRGCGEMAAPSKPISIVNNKCWRRLPRARKHVPSSHKTCWISLLKAPVARASPVSA